MDIVMQNVNNLTWQIDLETAIANGLNRLKQAEECDKQDEKELQTERARKWAEYNEQLRACLPEVLRPLMRSFHDLRCDPNNRAVKEDVILDGEKYNLVPVEVNLIRKTLADPYQVDYYLIFGVAHSYAVLQKHFFAIGDENFVVDPEIERDYELMLAKAMKVFSRRIELDLHANYEEPEYIATGEDIPLGLNDQTFLTALRTIVRDEMYRPPEITK